MSRIPFAVCVLAFALALAACASRRDYMVLPAEHPPLLSGFEFPAPDSMKLPAYAEADLTQLGKNFLPAYTSANVQAQADGALFQPSYNASSPDFGDLSFAIYQLGAPGFDRDNNLIFTWQTTADFNNGWVGLADFLTNSWDWFALPATNSLPFDQMNHFTLGGEKVLVAFVFAGTDSWVLSQFRLGAVPQPPAIPQNVMATDGTLSDKIRVTWDKTPLAEDYLVYRDDTSTPLAATGDVSIYYDTSVNDPDAHRYWVRATNQGGDGDLSAFDIGWRGSSPVGPQPPPAINATDGAYLDKIILVWFKPFGAQQYEIFRDDMFTPIDTVGDVNMYTDTGVSDGNVHTYWLRAINSFGTSAFSPSDTGYIDSSPQGPGDWAMFGRDKSHTCLSPFTGPQTNNLQWACDLSALAGLAQKCGYSSPVLSIAGVVYIATDRGNLFAIYPDGSEKWHLQLAGLNLHTPAVGPDGTIYVASGGNALFAVNSSGELQWTYTASTATAILSGPVVIGDSGVVYVAGNTTGEIYAIDSTGNDVAGWPFPIQDAPATAFPPVLSPDGQTVYGGAGAILGSAYFHAINLDGSEDWKTSYATGADASPTVDILGNIYYSPIGSLVSLKPDGSGENWSFLADHQYGCTGLDEASNSLYFGTNTSGGNEDGHFSKYGNDSSFSWENDQTHGVVCSPAIDSAGNVYYGGRDGYVYGYAGDQSLLWSYDVGAEVWSSPALGSDGVLYIGAEDGKLYAFGPTL